MNLGLERLNRGTAAAVGFLAVSLVFVVLAVGLKLSLFVPSVDADRGATLGKNLAEIRAAEDAALNHPAVLDAQRGTLRLPIETAMQLAAQAWTNPAAARADLNARAEKAAAALPKAPEKPSIFE